MPLTSVPPPSQSDRNWTKAFQVRTEPQGELVGVSDRPKSDRGDVTGREMDDTLRPDPQFRRKIVRWHRTHAREFPWRSTRDPYRVLIGEILLQRTRGENAAPVFDDFTRRWPTLEAYWTATRDEIVDVIRPLGLEKRADYLVLLARRLQAIRRVPLTPEELLELPGVGPYAAHAVPIFSTGRSLPLVDWVIARVLRRYFGAISDGRPNADRELWELASALASHGGARQLWLGVLDLAAEVCTSRPKCSTCPLQESCASAVNGAA